ncbi:hemerythrin domain-containing protein [Streptosporangium sp. NPDC048047]|uniref:hemerythrin domain-containing protein n=1 Tax=Streptosporangium sp. NPDC048047 TaxID=3155748 RepID=UPI00343672EC
MDVVGDPSPPAVRRRDLLGLPVIALGAATGPQAAARADGADPSPAPGRPSGEAAGSPEEVPVTPPEDLMREHGVLKRVLLVYREGMRRIGRGERVPSRELHDGARVIREFIQDYHEESEEKHVFPRLRRADRLTGTVDTLQLQHRRGRVLTDRILETTGSSRAPDARARRRLTADMAAFVRMYEPHEAREDTVVFPAFRDLLPPRELLELSEVFEEDEHRRFGPDGFTDMVNRVADIERSLGIHDLTRFTPRV